MEFEIIIQPTAKEQLKILKEDKGLKKRYKAVSAAIKKLVNPKHPGLETHEFTSKKGPNGEKVFIAYAENDTPAAYRLFWYYGPSRKQITLFAITSHP